MKLRLTSTYRLGFTAVALLFLILGCGKDNASEVQPAMETITDISVISNTADRRTLVGRQVDIPEAPITSVVGNYLFWAGETHTAVPVVREDKMRGPVTEHVRPGGRAHIKGTVRLLETVPDDDLMWDRITPEEKSDILGARVYIAAESVAVRH